LDSFPPFSFAQLTTQIVIESVNLIDATAELKFAAAFVDQQDERKPIVLVISDQKLPVEKGGSSLLTSSSLARRALAKAFGVASHEGG
jgi:hypothetical protein